LLGLSIDYTDGGMLVVSVLSQEFWLVLVPGFDPLIERLQHSRVNGRNYIDCGVELFLRHPRFPCVRKALIHSRITQPHHRHGESHEQLFALGQAFHRMRIAVKGPKIGFVHRQRTLVFCNNAQAVTGQNSDFRLLTPHADFTDII